MKEQLDEHSRDEYVYYRLQRSEETLAEADLLAKSGHFSGAVNRLYYACYYAVSALLIENEIPASTHVGVRSMFALKFIRTNKMDISHGKLFNEVFQLRQSNDYEDFIFCDEETYQDLRPRVEALISAIKKELYPDS